MRKIDFTPPVNDEWNNWTLRCQSATAELTRRRDLGQSPEIDESLYKEFKDSLYMAPDGPFRGKCAYCEDTIAGDQPGDIEHYRPKKEVRDIRNRIIMRLENDVQTPHPGYYWLAYDWKNLLASCNSCNRRRLPTSQQQGKGNRFPVDGDYAWKPGDEVDEKPLLLNPLWDDPGEHLSIDETGTFSALSARGEVTLELFRLNDRGLPDRRASLYEDTSNAVKIAIISLIDLGQNDPKVVKKLRRLDKILAGCGEFTAAARQAINDFETRAPGLVKFCLTKY